MNDTDSGTTTTPFLSGWKATGIIVCGLVAATLLAAAMPARIKLLGLFPVAFAALLGYVFGRVAMLAGIRRRGVLLPLTAVVVAAGLAGYYAESFRRWRSEREQFYADHIERQPGGKEIIQRLQANTLSSEPLIRQIDEQYRGLLSPTFTDYLEQRVAKVRIAGRDVHAKQPWSTMLFLTELTMGALAGLCASWAVTRSSFRRIAQKVSA